MKNRPKIHNQEGFALLAALATVLILAGVAAGLSSASYDNLRNADTQLLRMKARLAAEGAVELAIAQAKADPEKDRLETVLDPMQQGAQQVSAAFSMQRRKAEAFGKNFGSFPPEKRLFCVQATGRAQRGEKSNAEHTINTILSRQGDQLRVLLWNSQ